MMHRDYKHEDELFMIHGVYFKSSRGSKRDRLNTNTKLSCHYPTDTVQVSASDSKTISVDYARAYLQLHPAYSSLTTNFYLFHYMLRI